MPTFETPASIAVTVDLGVGYLRVTATDRTDTVVEVRPSDENDESDVQAAQQVRVDYANGALRITGPKIRAFDFSRKTRSADVTIELPSGSQFTADLQMGGVSAAGVLGVTRVKTSAGNVALERTGPLRIDTSAGHVTAGDVAGNAEIYTGAGRVQLGAVAGTVNVKNSNGHTTVDAAGGDVRVRAANGDIRVGRAGAGVDAKTSNGGIQLGEVVRGAVTLATAMGDLEVGIAAGTAAWLEVNTSFGKVHNQLENAAGPDEGGNTVEVRGRTSYGDIVIHRA